MEKHGLPQDGAKIANTEVLGEIRGATMTCWPEHISPTPECNYAWTGRNLNMELGLETLGDGPEVKFTS
jgi:hypothetical protein